MNTRMQKAGLMVLAVLLLLSFIPWGSGQWGWTGLFQYAGYRLPWMSEMGGWLVNILLMVIIGLGIVWILARLQRSERGPRS